VACTFELLRASNARCTGGTPCMWYVVQYKGGPPRSLEELKGRYYGVARALMVGRAGGEELIANEPLVKAPFDAAHEQCAPGPCRLICCALVACALPGLQVHQPLQVAADRIGPR
jgi:hypothetical protein